MGARILPFNPREGRDDESSRSEADISAWVGDPRRSPVVAIELSRGVPAKSTLNAAPVFDMVPVERTDWHRQHPFNVHPERAAGAAGALLTALTVGVLIASTAVALAILAGAR